MAHFSETAESRYQSMSKLACEILQDGYMKREMYRDTVQGENVVRQRFHQTPWPDPDSLTFDSISAQLSPGEPFKDCPAHESYHSRFCAHLGNLVAVSIEHALKQSPELRNHLYLNFVATNWVKSVLEAATFLPDLWQWWYTRHSDLYTAWKSERLQELAKVARKA